MNKSAVRFLVKFLPVALLTIAGLTACASGPAGLTILELETDRYKLTERRRLPIDFAEIQRNLFHHAKVCGETYTFELVPGKTSYGRVIHRETPDAGWENSVVLYLILLHNRSVNVTAYSYYAGRLERARMMMTAMMRPETCTVDTSWENRLDDDEQP